MLRLIYGLVFFPLYLGWIFYRLFIKKDLKQNMNDFYALTFFMVVWCIIYYFIFF